MGDRALRACLIGLVLVDLVFVHLTEAARPAWVVALALLTVLSPLLAPLRERLVYRGLWNLAVLGLFALLLHHATGSDLRYVLEDGLVLAALCQVHLLNNLRADQRPELLFLNSFLIAVVTGYLSQDLAFAAAFALYAPLLVAGLCLYDLARVRGGAGAGAGEPAGGPPGGTTRRVALDALARSAALLAATLLVFAVWPRDFQRRGLLADYVDLASGGGDEVGFDDELSLDQHGRARASAEIVLRVRLESGAAEAVPALWRGATLMATSGQRWWPFADDALGQGHEHDSPWRAGEQGQGLVRGAGRGALASVLVEDLDGGSDRLFAPLAAERLGFDGRPPSSVVARGDATLVLGEPGSDGSHGPVRYRLGLGPEPGRGGDGLGGRTPARLPQELRPYVALPPSRGVTSAIDLAAELALEVSGAEQRELVARFSEHLSSSHAWLPPGAEGAAGTLAEFLDGGAGHCEFFASALAIMLRSRGVPCRVVTGYRSEEWDAERRVLTIRRLHAHAWVEVLDPLAGWYAVDPNPAPALGHGPSALERLRGELMLAWQRLTAFDGERRAALLSALRGLPAQLARSARARPGAWGGGALVGLLLAAGVALVVRLRRRAGRDPARLDYERVVRRLGLRREPAETPRELLERVRALPGGPRPEELESLRTATRSHERARYAAPAYPRELPEAGR